MLARVTLGSISNSVGVFGCGSNSPSTTEVFLATLKPVVSTVVIIVVIIVVVVVTSRLAVALPHTDVTANSNSAALIGDSLAKLCALHETGELLGAVDSEGVSLDLHSEVDTKWKIAIGRLDIEVLLLLGGLEQAKGQAIDALVADRKIGEDEVAGFRWTVEIGHARGRNTGENRWVVGGGGRDTAVSDLTGMLETGVEKEVGIVIECDVLAFFYRGAFNNSKLDNGGRINGSAVTVGYRKSVLKSYVRNASKHMHLVRHKRAYPSCRNRRLGLALVVAGQSSGTRDCGFLL